MKSSTMYYRWLWGKYAWKKYIWKNSQTFSKSKVYVGMHVQSLSFVWLFDNPWIKAFQASLSMSFSRQNIWVGFHFLVQVISLTQGSDCICLYLYLHYSEVDIMWKIFESIMWNWLLVKKFNHSHRLTLH